MYCFCVNVYCTLSLGVNQIRVNKYTKYEPLILRTLKITMSLHIPAVSLTAVLRLKCFTISPVKNLHHVRYKINVRPPTWQPGNIPHDKVISNIKWTIVSSVVHSNYLLEVFFYWHSVSEQTPQSFSNISSLADSTIRPCSVATPSKEGGICDTSSTNAQT
jgi:hypothetical protein